MVVFFSVTMIKAKLDKKQMIDKTNHMIDVIFMSTFQQNKSYHPPPKVNVLFYVYDEHDITKGI